VLPCTRVHQKKSSHQVVWTSIQLISHSEKLCSINCMSKDPRHQSPEVHFVKLLRQISQDTKLAAIPTVKMSSHSDDGIQ